MPKEKEFESIESIKIKEERSELRGKEFLNIFDEIYYIVKYQFDKCIKNGIKGFIFYGDVGVGKTYCGKALSKELRVPLYFIDGKDIARSAYGESENRINHLFQAATLEKSIILIDDVESIFPKREWIKGQEWNVALSNVFFHEVDNLDTSKNCIILTTNKFDLVDKAVKDRLYPIKFPYPDLATLEETAKKRCSELLISSDGIIKNLKELFAGNSNGTKMDPIDEIARIIVSEDIDPSSYTGRSWVYDFIRRKKPDMIKDFEAIYHACVVKFDSLKSEEIRSFRNLEKIINKEYIRQVSIAMRK